MGKLTKAIREEIIEEASEGLFAKEWDLLRKRRNALADATFNKHIATPAQYTVMRKLPSSFFNTSNELRCYFASEAGVNEECADLELSQERRFPAFASKYARPVFVDSDAYDEFLSIKNAENALRKKRDEIVKQITQVVLSVNTAKRLLEIWPEGAKFIPPEVTPTSGVPMVLVSGLNAALVTAGVELSPTP